MTTIDILDWEHIGIRVTDRDRSVRFYQQLGFVLEAEDQDGGLELMSQRGIRINLICNAEPNEYGNVLLDAPKKWPGHTHPAWVVSNLKTVESFARENGIPITEGPKESHRRRYLFFRDPDGNVLEFNELI